jgi:hypothetical protein
VGPPERRVSGMAEDKKICPLLFKIEDLEHWGYCKEEQCAWYIPEYKNCAIKDLAVSLDEIREERR